MIEVRVGLREGGLVLGELENGLLETFDGGLAGVVFRHGGRSDQTVRRLLVNYDLQANGNILLPDFYF